MYKENYNKLVNLAKEEFNVKIALEDVYDDNYFEVVNLITINRRQNWRGRYYALMHELGHLIVNKDKNYVETFYPLGKKSILDARPNSKKYYISLVFEELDAWKIGLIYAMNHNLIYDLDYFHKAMTDNVMSHALYGIKKIYF